MKKKVRVDLRKNRTKPPRKRDWSAVDDESPAGERVRAKGDLSRKRTIMQEEGDQSRSAGKALAAAPSEMPIVDGTASLPGRVLRVQGLLSMVETDDGRQFRCAIRRLLKSLATDERGVVAPGDRVWFRPSPGEEGFIEKVEPRHGILTRSSKGREHVMVANVDQVVIVASLVEPELKPHLIDRYLVSAAQGNIAPIICLNKADLVHAAAFQPLIGLYSQLGVPILLTSAADGHGIDRLRKRLVGRETVFAGQSGVGKSSLLNALQPGLDLQVREVSEVNEKGKHTTTTAQLIRLDCGGWVVDTPGIRQFQLWDIMPEELEGYFPEFRPYVPHCGYPDCTHTHEDRCAIKRAVDRGHINERRYHSYLGMFTGKLDESKGY